MEKVTKAPEYWMKEALKEARLAEMENEIPIGAVVVKNERIIGRGHNQREKNSDLFSHAEINAVKEAIKFLKDWRLTGCDMYVTLEPCPMCSGVMLQAKLSRVFFGAFNEREGCGGSVILLLDYPGMNWQIDCHGGILQNECSFILKNFAEKMRK
ncbi:MAG: tRNA adenosine(34) deaminase TadA [Candidatus Bruticola sp.]